MKVCFLDIEATNLDADFGTLLTVGVKPLGLRPHVFVNRWVKEPDDSVITSEVCDELAKYDIVVTFNGAYFDFAFLNTKTLEHHLPAIRADLKHIDLFFTCRRYLKIHNKSLDAVCQFLGIEGKTHLDGKRWRGAAVGRLADLAYVREHNRQDVIILEKLYERMKPYISTIRTLRW